MEVFSPVGSRIVDAATPEGGQEESAFPRSSVFRPSSLRQSVTLESGKKSYPLLERLQSAIKSIEERTPLVTVEGDLRPPQPHEPVNIDLKPTPAAHIANVHDVGVQPVKGHNNVDYGKIEKMIDGHCKRLYDSLQTDMHALHMDMLKQCLAVQKHQEALLKVYLPEVQELVQELRVLRDDNARLRNLLNYQ